MAINNPVGLLAEASAWWRGLSNAQRFFALALLLAPVVLLHSRDGRNLALLLIGLPGLWFGFRVGFLRFLETDGRRWLWLVWLFLGVGLLAWAANDFIEGGFGRLARHDRLLFFVPWLITLVWLRPPARVVWLILAIAGIGIGIGAILEVALSGDGLRHRVHGAAHTMSFGIVSALFATLLAGAAWQQRGRDVLAGLLLAGAVLALVGVVASGVRAAFLAYAAGIAVLALLFFLQGERRAILVFLGTPLLLLSAALLFAADGITARFGNAVVSLSDYYHTEAMMPDRADSAATGCQDNSQLLQAWLQSGGYQGDVGAVVVDGESGEPCGLGSRFRLTGQESGGQARFLRSVHEDFAPYPARLHLRGQAATVRVQGGNWRPVPAELSELTLEPGEAIGRFVEFRLEQDGWVEWVPNALYPGEYRYPHVTTSMGQRLEMWRLALAAFREKPLLGHGTGAFQEITAPSLDAGLAAEMIRPQTHAHNEYIDSLATRGLIGLMALVALLAALVWLSLRSDIGRQQNARNPGIPFAAAWVALAVAFLAEAALSLNLNSVTIGLLMALCLYLSDRWQTPEDWRRNRLAFWR